MGLSVGVGVNPGGTAATPAAPAPLAGIKVLDLSRVLAGPWAGQLLADYGADVIKVERPGSGDDTRGWGPPWWGEGAGRTASYYLSANRGKRSVAIDLASAEGATMVRQLAGEADVLIENYKVGQLARYGLDPASLSALNPALVYCSVTGFGQSGPLAHRAGYDFAIQATGGLMSITGAAEGEPEKVGVAVADLFTGVYATTAILAALQERARTGRGRHIDAALLDAQVAMLGNQASAYLATGRVPRRMGNAHISIVPYQVFPTADGHIVVAVGNDGQFAAFCRAAGQAALAQDARFQRNTDRVERRAELVPLITGWMLTRTTAQWEIDLEAAGVPCAPILDMAGVFAYPQVLARGMQLASSRGEPMVATPMCFDGQRPVAPLPPPRLDEHGDAIRAALGQGKGWPPAGA